MARVGRSALPDGFFHVYARSVLSGALFIDDEDRRAFVRLIGHSERRHDWRVHAYTILSTHFHLVVESRSRRLSEGMHVLSGAYAHAFNKRHGRFGHVFAERFQARVIESEDYLYDACAYVLQNPVHAGLCDQPEDWPWSFSRYEL